VHAQICFTWNVLPSVLRWFWIVLQEFTSVYFGLLWFTLVYFGSLRFTFVDSWLVPFGNTRTIIHPTTRIDKHSQLTVSNTITSTKLRIKQGDDVDKLLGYLLPLLLYSVFYLSLCSTSSSSNHVSWWFCIVVLYEKISRFNTSKAINVLLFSLHQSGLDGVLYHYFVDFHSWSRGVLPSSHKVQRIFEPPLESDNQRFVWYTTVHGTSPLWPVDPVFSHFPGNLGIKYLQLGWHYEQAVFW
jgi:hypothetical protein